MTLQLAIVLTDPIYHSAAAAAAKSLQSCPILSDPVDCSPPGSSAHGSFQARALEWGAVASSAHSVYNWEKGGPPDSLAFTKPSANVQYGLKTKLCGQILE